MCGRFSLLSDLHDIIRRFNIAQIGTEADFSPRYNIAPSQKVWTVVNDGKNNRLGQLRWGLIPFWAKEASIGNRLINARAETLAVKPSFKYAFRKRRCLILADSFYEWKQTPSGRKKPMRIRLTTEEPFAFAGLWERWKAPDGEEVTTCTIVTTEANAFLKPIHHRMPVILHKEEERTWLDRTIEDRRLLEPLFTPYPADALEAYEVSTAVNSARNDDPACIAPLEAT